MKETSFAHSAARAAVCTLTLAAVGLVGLLASPASRAADVGVSISVSQPGVYGRIDIGRFPQPELIVPQPVVIRQPRVVVAQPVQPVYLWVPPGHQKNWGKHCYRYNACGVPVYFVKEEWYRAHVAPAPMMDRRGPPEHAQGRGRGHGHD
ncbi:hypothetical protein [Ideonella sp.]|uniref:hypothetical protein n=1 Tax=Ideonella sp. TaxID=1929293 RepID=UPI0035B3E530